MSVFYLDRTTGATYCWDNTNGKRGLAILNHKTHRWVYLSPPGNWLKLRSSDLIGKTLVQIERGNLTNAF